MAKTLRHIDSIDLDAPERTEEGYIRLEGVVATPGVLVYWRDGEAVCEYVPAETLKDPKYLESLDGKSLCVEHPDGQRIGPQNVRMLEVGTAFDNRYVDGTGHCATFLIKAPEGIEAYQDGCDELSPAYHAELREQTGIYQGQTYDYVQTKRRAGNHIAMTRQGRRGRAASFHTDSYVRDDAPAAPTDIPSDHTTSTSQAPPMAQDNGTTMHQVELNGRSIPLRADQADVVQQFKRDQEQQQMELSSELEQARDQIKEFKEEISTLEEELNTKKSQLEMMRKELGLDDGEMPKMGEGSEGGESDEGSEPGERDASDMGGMEEDGDYMEDKEDAFMKRHRERNKLEATAEELGIDGVEDMRTDALKAEIVNGYLGDGRAVESRLDSQCEAIVEMVESGAKRRDDSERKLSERAQDGFSGGRSDGEGRRTGAWKKTRTR